MSLRSKKQIKLKDLQAWFLASLANAQDAEENQALFRRLLDHHSIPSLDLVMNQAIDYDSVLWDDYVDQLKQQVPIQYILGYEYFGSEKYMVNSDVLIPRPETEELVNWIAEDYTNHLNVDVLEIGTGSGCIAISLAKKLNAPNILATDISDGALAVAKINANEINAKVEFLKDDILKTNLSNKTFDIIVSNPPYIPLEEAVKIDARVKDHEPNLALFTEEKKPLQFYEAIVQFAIKNLHDSGSLYFEIHEDYAHKMVQLAKTKELEWEIKKDIYGKERMMRIKKDEH